MTDKQKRQQALVEIIETRAIGRQEDLISALQARGLSSTQSTLSKDLRDLGVAKVPTPDGGVRYQMPQQAPGWAGLSSQALLHRELSDFVIDLDGAGHTLVIKTITGHAQGVCEAVDRAEWGEVVGTLAGENTIFVLCKTEAARKAVAARIRDIREA